jgi:hypothetical protein
MVRGAWSAPTTTPASSSRSPARLRDSLGRRSPTGTRYPRSARGPRPGCWPPFPAHLALLVTELPGAFLPDLHVKVTALQRIHWRSGVLAAQLHRAGKPTAAAHREACTVLSRLAEDAALHLGAAGGRLSTDEQKLVLHLADRLRVLGRLPLGFVHGALESSLVWRPQAHLSLRDFEASRFAPVVVDFARLACGPWVARPRLRHRFFDGYGRPLSEDERLALRCLMALHAARTIADGREYGPRQAQDDARFVLARLNKEVGV